MRGLHEKSLGGVRSGCGDQRICASRRWVDRNWLWPEYWQAGGSAAILSMLNTAQALTSPKRHVQAIFDALANEYVEQRETQLSFVAQKRIVLNMLSGSCGSVLEVGCGPGTMFGDFLAAGFTQVHGIDVSPEMIRQARQRIAGHPLRDRCDLRIADVEQLPYGNESFDAVVAMGVLEYLPTYSRALLEIRRVLRRGGRVVLTVPNRASPYHLARSAYFGLRRLLGVPRKAKFAPNPCTPWSLDGQLTAANMRKVANTGCNFILFPLAEFAPRLSDALNSRLTPLSATPLAPLLGTQYIVKAVRP